MSQEIVNVRDSRLSLCKESCTVWHCDSRIIVLTCRVRKKGLLYCARVCGGVFSKIPSTVDRLKKKKIQKEKLFEQLDVLGHYYVHFQFQIQNWLSDVLGVPLLRFGFHAIVYQYHLIDLAHKIFFKKQNRKTLSLHLFYFPYL